MVMEQNQPWAVYSVRAHVCERGVCVMHRTSNLEQVRKILTLEGGLVCLELSAHELLGSACVCLMRGTKAKDNWAWLKA